MHDATAARESARHDNGQFGEQHHTAPETTITPKQLGIIGLGPESVNTYAEPYDAEEWRPARPYLALRPSDDDEFFDARVGSRITLSQDGATRTFELTRDTRYPGPVWSERSARNVETGVLEPGDLWAEMFDDDGRMHSARLSAPVDVLFSDRTYYAHRSEIDTPLAWEEARDRLTATSRARLVSRSVFGDSLDDGVPEVFQGTLRTSVTGDGYFSYSETSRGPKATRSLHLTAVEVFDRNGDIVIRKETDPGYGFEEVLRPLP